MLSYKKEIEKRILKDTPIIITTCKASNMPKLSGLNFERVIIDEAAQS